MTMQYWEYLTIKLISTNKAVGDHPATITLIWGKAGHSKKEDYAVMDTTADDKPDYVNCFGYLIAEAGKTGWELVSVTAQGVYVFKRPLDENKQSIEPAATEEKPENKEKAE